MKGKRVRLSAGFALPTVITEAYEIAPAEVSPLVARALVFFDDAAAQSAAETFISNSEVLTELRRLSREKGLEALF